MVFDMKHKSMDFIPIDKAANRAMLRAVGVDDEGFKKPFVGVASADSDVTPCNMHLDKLASNVREGIKSAGGVSFLFHTITVSDGIAMGTEGMRFSLTAGR